MTYLITILGAGKGTWSQLAQLLHLGSFEQAILITNTFGKEHYVPDARTRLLVTDFNLPLTQLRDDIKTQLAPMLTGLLDTDVAVNLTSGLGHEHMAAISAILQLGLGIRLVSAQPSMQASTGGTAGFLEL